jgi:two-component system sensor histidine kinase BaeS
MPASRLDSQKNAKKTNALSADSSSPAEDLSKENTASDTKRDSPAQILSDAAGELMTSVGAIQEGLEDLIDDEDPEEKEHMQSLLEETDRLRKIIDGMEQLSQAQALARALRKESIKLEPLLNAVMEKSRLTAQGGGVTFTLECDPALGITGDPDCLRRILENLMDNAVKAVKNAGSVTLAALRKGDEVVFSVKDTGTGIRPKHLSHIYERFFRGTGTGIGMGLTIVKELVDACEGKIEVQTEPGKGSVFTLHIPSS